jgi:hypothetical protein
MVPALLMSIPIIMSTMNVHAAAIMSMKAAAKGITINILRTS